ncbi:hypothetical protein LPTSP2_04570 [Leptospira ellinghausenii]|uniref:Uncharacterized protein n=1 Tax=Leptospira ellinghausenii TaxID=1917822 RepID=A0A2P2D986_9LEPT|nr:hypothetical protein [Leptospira ellinghausenii]GBF41185.1 hypothetical protein LPTSP2_04570 [Leptospira ellinghausenii]
MSINWENIISSIIGSGIILGLLKLFFTQYIGNLFNYSLEDHKHKLSATLEEIKHQFETDLVQKRIYIEKKNIVYSELYSQLLDSYSNIRSLYGLTRSLTFEEYSRKDIENFLQKRNIVDGKIKEIIATFDENREISIDKMKKYLRMLDFQEARSTWNSFHSYYLKNELYLSSSINKSVFELKKRIHNLLLLYEQANNFPGSLSWTTDIAPLENEIDSEIEVVLNNFKTELQTIN